MTKGEVKRALALKRRVLRLGIPYRDIATDSKRSWSLVYHVLNGRKTAPVVTETAERLVKQICDLKNARLIR